MIEMSAVNEENVANAVMMEMIRLDDGLTLATVEECHDSSSGPILATVMVVLAD